MKILVTTLIVVFAISIIFGSSHDAFALVKPKVASIDLVKTVSPSLILNPTSVTYTYKVTNTGDVFCQVRNTFPATGLVDTKLGVIPTPKYNYFTRSNENLYSNNNNNTRYNKLRDFYMQNRYWFVSI